MENIIYAYWNGQQIYDILNAVVLVTGGSNADAYKQLMQAIALVAFLVSVGVGLAKLRATDTVTAFMALTFFYGIFFVPTTTVYIQDVRKGTNYHVDNVPYGVALFGSATSHIGYWLTDVYETYFTAVDDEKFSHYGMLFGHRLVEEFSKQDFMSPVIRENMSRFIKDCVNPELLDNQAALNAMVKSPDLWKFVSGDDPTVFSVNPGRTTVYIDQATSTSIPIACDGTGGAVEKLTADTAAEATNQKIYLGNKMHPGNASATALIAAQTPVFEATLMGVSRTSEETIRHFSMMNMLRYANDQTGALSSTMAVAASENSYSVMKTLAEGALPKIRNLVETLILSVFPIVFLLVIAAGSYGGKVLMAYATAAVWVQLWAPLYAVINKLTYSSFTEATTQLTGGTGGTIENMNALLQMSVSDQALAGLLTISVPAIALAIVKGGAVAMSGVVSSLMSPSQGISSKIGSDAGLGNFGAGNVNWGNLNYGNSAVMNSTWGNATAQQQQLAGGTTVGMDEGKVKTPHGTMGFTPWSGGGGKEPEMTSFSPNQQNSAGASVRSERADGSSFGDTSTVGARNAQGNDAQLSDNRQAGFSSQNYGEFMRRAGQSLQTRLGAEFRDNISDGSKKDQGSDSRAGFGSGLTTEERGSMRAHLGFGGGGRDESFTGAEGRSSTSYTQPGVTAPGGGGGIGNGSKGGSGNSLPVPAGSAGPDVRHDNSLNRGRRTSGGGFLSGDLGGGVDTMQRMQDVAENKTGQFSKAQQDWAAQHMAAAVNDTLKNTNDEGVRAAGKKFMSDSGWSKRLSEGQSANSQDYQEGGQRIEKGSRSSHGGSMTSDKPVIDAARAMVQENEGLTGISRDARAMQLLKNDEGFRGGAVSRAVSSTAPATDGLTKMSDAPNPVSPGQIRESGDQRVAALGTQGNDEVSAAASKASGQASAKQPFSPTSLPNTTRATSEYGRVQGASQSRVKQQADQNTFDAGRYNLANQLYQAKEHGMLKVASIQMFGAAGYDSPSGYADALNQAGASDPSLRKDIARFSGGQKASEKDLEGIYDRIAAKLK